MEVNFVVLINKENRIVEKIMDGNIIQEEK
jgi:hypothetical protein